MPNLVSMRSLGGMAALMVPCIIATLMAPEPSDVIPVPKSLEQAVVAPLKDFFGRNNAWLILLLIILLLFGATKLPRLARSLGESARIFKSEVKTMRDEDSEKTEEQQDEDTRAVEGNVIDPTADVHRGKDHKGRP